jgi:small-conductance mechanosensitive channel
MEISSRATQAIITGVVGVAAVIAVRLTLDFVYNRYERRLKQRDPMAVARRRTTFNFTRRVVVALVGVIAIWAVLSLYDITSEIGKALLASSAVLALFAGLAFSTPLSNLGSGLLVAFTQPLRLGDRISVGGETGFVEEMALIYTTLVTDDARRIFIPNTQLTTSMIVNRTIKDPRRLVSAHFPVSIATPIDEARAVLLDAIVGLPGTSGESARVLVGEINDRTVWLEAATYGPIDADVVSLASELRELGLGALRDKGFLAA